jgi:antitoxin component YwqK of YwqJK toxin-antitoxin module
MKKLLIAMFVALLMVGCGEDAPSSSSSSSSDTTEPSKPKTIDFDDNETLDGRIAEAIDGDKLQRGKEGGEIDYAPNGQTPYSGWAKEMHSNGQMKSLVQYKDGKRDGLDAGWYENGQKQWEVNYKDGKRDGLETGWYQNGQKEYEGNWKDGEQDGLWIFYNEDGTEKSRLTFKDGEVVED